MHMLNKKTNFLILSATTLAISIAGFLYFSSSKRTEQDNPVDIPKTIQLGDETIDLSWTDDNQGEDLIIQSDKKSYFGINSSEVYFSLTNTNKKDQKIDLRFLFANKEAKLEKIEKITGEKTADLVPKDSPSLKFENKENFLSSNYFNDKIGSGETNYYKARMTYPTNSEGEFYVEAKGDNGAYGLLDPWYNSTGLVGYWSMDGDDVDWSATTAEVIDRSGQGNHGNAYGMDGANAYVGKSGQALDFGGSGSGDYIVPPSSDLNTYINDTTVVAWVKFDNHAGASFTPIYNNNTSGNANLNIYMDVSADRLRCLSGNSAGDVITTLDISDNVWYLAACTRSVADNQLKLYVDGVLKAADSYLTARTYNAASPVAIGTSAYSQGNYLFDGKIDELAVFNRALSADEIIALYKLGNRKIENKAVNNTGLVGYWSMDNSELEWGQTSAEVRDGSGQGKHGDAIGMSVANSVDGRIGGALDFDGDNDYVQVADSDSFTFTNGTNTVDATFTISLWMNADTNHAGQLISKYIDDSPSFLGEWSMGTSSCNVYGADTGDNCISMQVLDDATTDRLRWETSGDDIPINKWVHVVWVYDGSETVNSSALYIDNSSYTLEYALEGTYNGMSNRTSPVQIGVALTNSSFYDYFDGSIDEVRIYRRALSADEISELYQMGAKKFNLNSSKVNRLTSGLVGHWTFDGADMDWSAATAEVIDRSGQGNHGDAIGDTKPAIGRVGQGLNFDGAGDYVGFDDDNAFNFGTGDFSFSSWIKIPSAMLSGEHSFFNTIPTSYGGWAVNLYDGAIKFYLNNLTSSPWHINTGITTVSADMWTNITIIRSGTDLKFYINGVLDQSFTNSDNITPGTKDLLLGFNGASDYFTGQVDEFRIYNRALSEDEVTELYNMGAKGLKIE